MSKLQVPLPRTDFRVVELVPLPMCLTMLVHTACGSNAQQQVADDTHWTSTRLPPSDFVEEQAWYLLRDPEPGTLLLFECMMDNSVIGEQTFITGDVGCEGSQGMGPVGYIWTSQITNSVALYRCRRGVSGLEELFVSTDPACEGGTSDGQLGYALPAP